jgi:tripartite-type tricarboxylate transporter receptor subunit TctC
MNKILIALFAPLLFLCAPSFADFPEKNVIYQITFSPGGGSDVRARHQQPHLEKELGKKVVIQYKPGAGGSIGWANLVKQKADGYFMSGINIPHIILQPLAREPGYQTEEIIPVVLFQQIPFGLTVLQDSPFKTLEDLIRFAKDNPGGLTIGGSGTWDATHIANLQFDMMADIETTYVPHKGGKPKQTSLLGGHTMASWFGPNEKMPHGDKVRTLAYATENPIQVSPDVPTFKSYGYPLYSSVYHGVGVPMGTPEKHIKVLEKAFLKIAGLDETKKVKLKVGIMPIALDSESAQKLIAEKKVAWEPIVKKFSK